MPGARAGRLVEECARLKETFIHATKYSLVLLNETISSTTPSECLYIAREVVSMLRALGCRAVYTTHLLDLASAADEINATVPGDSDIVSIVAGIDARNRRTYRIIPGAPLLGSYARDIASQYGITLQQYRQAGAAQSG